MRFTAQEEYGLRCLLQMARTPDASITLPELALREGITPSYAAKIMRMLRQAGIVRSVRGKKGGYTLTRPANETPVAEVLGCLGGRLFPEDFCTTHSGELRVCVHNTDCSIRALLSAVDRAVDETLRQTMLTDLLCSERTMNARLRRAAGTRRAQRRA